MTEREALAAIMIEAKGLKIGLTILGGSGPATTETTTTLNTIMDMCTAGLNGPRKRGRPRKAAQEAQDGN